MYKCIYNNTLIFIIAYQLKSTLFIIHIYNTNTMSRKSKSIKKIQEEQPSIEEEIAAVHNKKQMFGQTYVQVSYKGNESKKEWKKQVQLKSNPTFLKKFISFDIIQKHKNTPINSNNVQSPQLKQSRDISLEKQAKNPQSSSVKPKKIHIPNEKIRISSLAIQQQLSLNKFFIKNTNKMVDENQKKEPTMSEQSKRIKQLMSKVKTETNTTSNKQKQQLLRQDMKTLNINEAPKQQVKVNPVWLDKIKSISRVKGYELKNGQMLYDVEVSDKNGQNFFIPPLPSEVVLKFDAAKLAGFLQECMLRGYAEQTKTK